MKRLAVLTVLIGYLLLAPACFLAGTVVYSAQSTAHVVSQTHSMMGMEMDSPMETEAHASPINALSNHLAMYIGLTGVTETTVINFALLVMCMYLIKFALQLLVGIFSTYTQSSFSRKTVRRTLRAIARHGEIRWLSLSFVSPPLLYALA